MNNAPNCMSAMSFDRKVTLIEVGPLAVIPTSLASALSGTCTVKKENGVDLSQPCFCHCWPWPFGILYEAVHYDPGVRL
jgi:hypothetical protein